MTLAVRDTRSPSILLVEDDCIVAEEIAEAVRQQGCTVVGVAESLESGLDLVDGRRFDGAIVDINLAGQPSFPICRALRSKDVPFLFLTGYSHSWVPREFEQAPCLFKPLDRSELAAAFRRLLAPPPAPRFGNRLLDSLAPELRRMFARRLERVDLKAGQVIESAGQPVMHVYFPTDGLISIFATSAAGKCIEVANVGRDGMTAPAVLLGESETVGDTRVQTAVRAWRIAASSLQKLVEENDGLRRQLLGHVGVMLREVMDGKLYAGRETIVGRLARWLLQASSQLDSPSLSITHDALAEILGVRRSGVTVALQILEGKGLIRAVRRKIVVCDPDGLAAVTNRLGLVEGSLRE